MRRRRIQPSIWGFVLLAALLSGAMCPAQQQGEKPWERRRRETQDRIGGLPADVLEKQSKEPVKIPSIEEAVKLGLAAARKEAQPLIDRTSHSGKVLKVPGDHETIQAAIDAAKEGEVVLVGPGTYFELLVMKDGVKLASDPADGGDDLADVKGAKIQLPRRTLRTILDGSKSKSSHHGMIDFDPGLGRTTVVDGFTIQNLPHQNHHLPGHAHGINVRGASPIITNCLIRKNGSTGIGNHVVYHDQGKPIGKRDFRWENVKHESKAIIYNNIIHGNLGLGIGCNHFSAPHILGNEVFDNDDSELGEEPSPGLGNKHGSAATIIGNIVHDNPGGGILCKSGKPQGAHPIDRKTRTQVASNVVYKNGTFRPGIGSDAGGSKEEPIRIVGNHVYHAGATGIGLTGGAVGVVKENYVSESRRAGIAIDGSTALELNQNKVTRSLEAPGFVILDGAVVVEMKGNASDMNQGPRFLLRGGTIEGKGGSPRKGPGRPRKGGPDR